MNGLLPPRQSRGLLGWWVLRLRPGFKERWFMGAAINLSGSRIFSWMVGGGKGFVPRRTVTGGLLLLCQVRMQIVSPDRRVTSLDLPGLEFRQSGTNKECFPGYKGVNGRRLTILACYDSCCALYDGAS
ncbi:hypothetical protein NPIL_63861 [Nephila pilipes]|uniref:Uncharacterized protein n=1 Tax=Nephila pilipes TaxID=299642 RepID=A0A8X6IQC0_NEPPI|nr:hypothetical protein NPIL_63861 [Nephila pilipes]